MNKSKIFVISALAVIAAGIIGCGGSSATGGSISRDVTRAKVAEALKGAAETSSQSRNLGRSPNKAKGFNLSGFRSLLASTKPKSLTRDGGDDGGDNGGAADGTSTGTDGGLGVSGGDAGNGGTGGLPPDPLKVGDRIEMGEDYFGIVTEVDQDPNVPYASYSTLRYDIFWVGNPNRAGKYESQVTERGGEFTNLQFSEINLGPQTGFYSRNEYTSNPSTGAMKQQYESRSTAEFEGKTYFNKVKFKVNFPGGGAPFTFESEQSLNGVNRFWNGKYYQDGRIELVWSTNSGYRVAWNQGSDLGGTVTITNPNDPLMPATGVFNAEGVGTLTFADGTTGSFDLYSENFWN